MNLIKVNCIFLVLITLTNAKTCDEVFYPTDEIFIPWGNSTLYPVPTSTINYKDGYNELIIVKKCFSFDIKSNSFISIDFGDKDFNDNYHNYLSINIGINDNKNSMMRSLSKWHIQNVSTPNILNNNEYRSFWITWYDNHFKFGEALQVEPLLEYRLEEYLTISFITFTKVLPGDAVLKLSNFHKCPIPEKFSSNVIEHSYDVYGGQKCD